MSAHIQQNDQYAAQYQTRQPRVTPVALSSALIFAIALIFFGMPLLVSGGLWLLGMALVLITYAFISYHRFAIPVWDTAIAGQVVGFFGISLLLLASFVSF
jgi:hypothetical protein